MDLLIGGKNYITCLAANKQIFIFAKKQAAANQVQQPEVFPEKIFPPPGGFLY